MKKLIGIFDPKKITPEEIYQQVLEITRGHVRLGRNKRKMKKV